MATAEKLGYTPDYDTDYEPEPLPQEVRLVREVNEKHGINDERDLTNLVSDRTVTEGIAKHVAEKWPQPAERYGQDLTATFNAEYPRGSASEYEREKAAAAVADALLDPLQRAWNRGTTLRIDFSMLNKATEAAIVKGLLDDNAASPAQIAGAINAATRWGGSLQPGRDPNLDFQPFNDSQHGSFANLVAARDAVNAGIADDRVADIHKAGYLTLLNAIAEQGYDRTDNKTRNLSDAARRYGTDSPEYAQKQTEITLHIAVREHFMAAAADAAVQGANAPSTTAYNAAWRDYHNQVADAAVQISGALGRTDYDTHWSPDRQPLPEPITHLAAATAELSRLQEVTAELQNPHISDIAHDIWNNAESRWTHPEHPLNQQDLITGANQLRFMLNHLQAADQSISTGNHPGRDNPENDNLVAKEVFDMSLHDRQIPNRQDAHPRFSRG